MSDLYRCFGGSSFQSSCGLEFCGRECWLWLADLRPMGLKATALSERTILSVHADHAWAPPVSPGTSPESY